MIMNIVANGIPLKKTTAIFLIPHVFLEPCLSSHQKVEFNFPSLWPWIRLSDFLLTNAVGYSVYKRCCVTLRTRSKRWCNFTLTLEMLILGTQPPCCEGAQAAHMESPRGETHVEWNRAPTPSQQPVSTAYHMIKQAFRWFQPQPLSLTAKTPDIVEQK